MPAKNKPITIHPDDITLQQWNKIKAYYEERNKTQGIAVSESYIGRELIRIRYTDIVDETTKAPTVRKTYAEVIELRREIAELRSLVEKLIKGKTDGTTKAS
jgi:hypothetical protein